MPPVRRLSAVLREEIPALASLGILVGLLGALIAYEAVRFSDARDRIRHQLAREAAGD